MPKITVQKVPKSKKQQDPRRLLAELCYYYPQYNLRQAKKLPYKDVNLLLKTAKSLEAMNYINLTNISVAPHTKNGKGVKKLIDQFKAVING